MSRPVLLLPLLSVLLGLLGSGWLLAPSAHAKARYNVWAKEKIRYHHQRVQRDPYNPEKRLLLASAYHRDGDYEAAAEQLHEALELQPGSPEAHCNLGIVRHAQRRVVDAESHYRAALEQDSTLVDAMAGLGTLLCANGRRGEGIDYLERTLRYDARRDDARYNLGVAYHRVGDFRNAVRHLDHLHERAPGYRGVPHALAQALFGRGLTLLQARQPAEALAFFQRSSRLDGSEANVHYAAGLAQLQLDDLAGAEAAFAAAVELEPEHVPALHNLANVLEQTGRPAAAADCFRRVARLTPQLKSLEAVRDATYDEDVLFR